MIAKSSHHQNPFLGLYCAANEKIALVPIDATNQLKTSLSEALQVEVVTASLCETGLLGLFCVMNSKHAVVSPHTTQGERDALRGLGLKLIVADEEMSAVGNNLLMNDSAALLNPHASLGFASVLEKEFGFPVKRQSSSGLSTVGAGSVVTNRGILVYPDTNETELKFLEKLFGVRGAVGTTNLGSPFNHMGIIANSKGAVTGELCTGFETGRIHEALFA